DSSRSVRVGRRDEHESSFWTRRRADDRQCRRSRGISAEARCRALASGLPRDRSRASAMAAVAVSMTGAPLVSVIIPAYNAQPYIDQALATVAAQTYRPLEVLVADDGSTDGTARCVERWRNAGLPVEWIEGRDRSGRPSVPRNRALRVARGELVAFLDAD